MALPSAFVVGAMKAGTTSLFRYLQQHPQLFLPDREEPNWFSFAGQRPDFAGPASLRASVNESAVTDRHAYEALFSPARPDQVLVDVSPTYLYVPEALQRIAELVPEPKAVAILRHPVDRAYSSFMHARREGREPIDDFEDALAAEPRRLEQNYGFIWRYADMSRYASQVRRLYETLGRQNVLILLTEDLAADAEETCRRVADFFGVDSSFRFDVSTRHNVSGLPRSRTLHGLLRPGPRVRAALRPAATLLGRKRLRDLQSRLLAKNLKRQPLAPEVRARLTAEFRADIEQLSQLIDRDLTGWLCP